MVVEKILKMIFSKQERWLKHCLDFQTNSSAETKEGFLERHN